MRPIIREIQKSGVNSLRGVAKALSARGVKTARGGEWSAVQVSDILERLGDRPFEAGAAGIEYQNHSAVALITGVAGAPLVKRRGMPAGAQGVYS